MVQPQAAIKKLELHREWLESERKTLDGYSKVDVERNADLWEKILHCSYCIGVLEG